MRPCSFDVMDVITDQLSTDGWQIYIGSEPDLPGNIITIYDREGDIIQSHNRHLWRGERIQILIKGLDYETTYAKMIEIQNLLIFIEPFMHEGSVYKGFVNFGTPYQLGLDDKRRSTWSINFKVFREETEENVS